MAGTQAMAKSVASLCTNWHDVVIVLDPDTGSTTNGPLHRRSIFLRGDPLVLNAGLQSVTRTHTIPQELPHLTFQRLKG